MIEYSLEPAGEERYPARGGCVTRRGGDGRDVPGSGAHQALLQQLPAWASREQLRRHGAGRQEMDARAGQEPINALGVVLGVGLALLILVLFGYTFVRWYQSGRCWRRPNFVFNLYHTCGRGSVAVELVPPFSVSGSLSGAASGYVPFHDRGP